MSLGKIKMDNEIETKWVEWKNNLEEKKEPYYIWVVSFYLDSTEKKMT